MIKFELQNLLTAERTEDGKFSVSGPMSPMMAAQKMVEQKLFPKLDGLASIHFEDPEYNQWYEGRGYEKYLTGCSTELLVAYFNTCTAYSLILDTGTRIIPISIWFSNDESGDFSTTKVYQNQELAKRLTPEDIQAIFQQAEKTDLKPKGLTEA